MKSWTAFLVSKPWNEASLLCTGLLDQSFGASRLWVVAKIYQAKIVAFNEWVLGTVVIKASRDNSHGGTGQSIW